MRIGIVCAIYLENDDHLFFLEKTMRSINSAYDCKLIFVENRVNNSVRGGYERLIEEFKVTRLQNEENNVSMAWNKGITKAVELKCSYILIPNTDILFKSNCIDNLVEFAEENTQYSMVTGSIWNSERTLESDNEDDGVAESPHFSCFMVRSNFLEATGGFDENLKPAYREDNDMHWRMTILKLSAVSIGSARFYHYGSRTIHASNDPRIAEIALGSGNTTEYYLKKWGGMPGEEKYLHPFNDKSKNVKDWKA